jgi:hypothetical protein
VLLGAAHVGVGRGPAQVGVAGAGGGGRGGGPGRQKRGTRWVGAARTAALDVHLQAIRAAASPPPHPPHAPPPAPRPPPPPPPPAHRDWRPDCWSGVWRRERFSKAYLCPLEDPFDATDNAARALGSESVSPGDQHVYIAAVMAANAAALRRLLLAAGAEAQQAGVRVLRGLAWTLGFRGIQLLQPPLPEGQLRALADIMGDPRAGSALQRLLLHLGADLLEEDILDHSCWKAYRARLREEERAAGGGQELEAGGGGSGGGAKQRGRRQKQENGAERRDGGAGVAAAAAAAVRGAAAAAGPGGGSGGGGGGGSAPQPRQPQPPPPPRQKPAKQQQQQQQQPRQRSSSTDSAQGQGAAQPCFMLGGIQLEIDPSMFPELQQAGSSTSGAGAGRSSGGSQGNTDEAAVVQKLGGLAL